MDYTSKCRACSLVRDACIYIQVYVPFVAVGLTSAQRASTERLVDDASIATDDPPAGAIANLVAIEVYGGGNLIATLYADVPASGAPLPAP